MRGFTPLVVIKHGSARPSIYPSIMPRLCSRCALTRVTADRTECRACADDAARHKGFEWQVRKYLEDHEDLGNFTYTDTALPCAARNASNARRADFTYVLEDRVVFLEVDENEHRYNSPDCERRREQQLADSVPEGKHVVLVRYNPLAKWTTWMINLERLGKALREAFVTEDVSLAHDGVHRMYVGYQMAQIRKLDAAYENVQRRAIEEARARENSDGDSPVVSKNTGGTRDRAVERDSSKLIREIADTERELKRKKKLLARALAAEEEGGEEQQSKPPAEKSAPPVQDTRDEFFVELAKEIHERAFTEKFVRSLPNANGIRAFDWSILAQNECHHRTSRSLYDSYKGTKKSGMPMSVYSFSRKLRDLGLFKAQKKVNNCKKTDVVWVGFKKQRR